MYTPHSVTVYNACQDGSMHLTFLDGVLLDTCRGSTLKNIPQSDDCAALFVPLDCKAVDPVTGLPQQFCAPKTFDQLEDKSGFWTIGPRDAHSGVECFFVKGCVVEPEMCFAEINDRYDGVFRVSTVDVRDFGSRNMRHWQIGGK